MHPILSDARRLPWYAAAWLALGALAAALLHAAGVADWERALLFALPLAVLYGFIAPSAYYLCRALPQQRRSFPRVSLAFACSALLSASLWLAACLAWNSVAEGGLIALAPGARAALFAIGFGLYLISLLAHDVVIAFETVREAARQEAQSRLLAREAELALLRLQINPHFLFNSLNSISALTSLDPAAARDMAIELAEFFRGTLALAERGQIALADEIALCRNFLAIEQRRFGSQLGYRVEADEAALACLLPPMLLQPLVENAVKHGIHGLDEGGVVAIVALKREGWLHLAVDNPVAADRPARAGHGLGLRNVRERLSAQYGERARLSWRCAAGHFRVELNLPQEDA
ncbi:sensor histidine kinase [Chromobacterium sp. IIBBL 290-4]|uniref:sensor histidine kinase n=1 Tax=Chromobacterium sp. IIBBL 290-4 TaxID=2953890 RepID=UPI0020B7F17A|nr:histidine kinase [Chromobacterium sp. IIBBL 290-4]UTH73548.1 histidine kinase [Chromobacterium sp. IIBBL 290-4]